MTLRELTRALAQHCLDHPADRGLEVVMSADSEGNSARALYEADFCGWFQPLEEQPNIGDIVADADADPENDRRVVILWPAV